MKKTALPILCVAFLLAASPAIHAADGAKPPFLVVDINKVLEGSNDAKLLTLKFQGAVGGANDNLNSYVSDMNAALTKAKDLQQQYTTATDPAAKDKIKSEFDTYAGLYQTKQQEATSFQQNAEKNLTITRQTYLQAVVLKIKSVAADIAKAKGVGAVVTSEIALYTDPSWDISDEVIVAVNKAPALPVPEVPSTAATPATTAKPATGMAPARSTSSATGR